MKSQKSYQNEGKEAVLYLVPTPIGNLEDMTFRAVRILKEVAIIAAEDTRNTIKLCNHFEIDTPLMSYHEHNQLSAGAQIIDKLSNGLSVAIVSDAGMPGISDPGYEIANSALEAGYKVISLPGANAALTALISSGILPQPFYFFGFLDRNKGKKKRELEELKSKKETLIFYESPHRLKETIQKMSEVFGDRKITLARELTKKFEEYIRGSLNELKDWVSTEEIRGEFVIIVEGSNEIEILTKNEWWQGLSIEDHVNTYINREKLKPNEAIKQVAKDRDVQKREVYQKFHIEK
ncbi:MAG: rsmI [Bacillales bacterium]|nr:rsmI [Bacillales bacterium]